MSDIEVKLNPYSLPTGSDLTVVAAARRSFGAEKVSLDDEGKLKETDKRLIQYLARGLTASDYEEFVLRTTGSSQQKVITPTQLWKWRDTPEHDTPFNHMFFSFDIKAPIFVARQLVKHEYMPWSEFSRRYKTDKLEFYTPPIWRQKAEDKKQGSLTHPVSEPMFKRFGSYKTTQDIVSSLEESSAETYYKLLDHGVCPEQARSVLPQSAMTEWTWSGTFGAFAQMLRLRLAEDTQYETRVVANKIGKLIKPYCPVSYEALVERRD